MLSTITRAFTDCINDDREIVVHNHHLGRALGRFRAGAHGNAEIGGPERRHIVHTVAGHRHDLPVLLQHLHHPVFVLREDAGKNRGLLQSCGKLVIAHDHDLRSGKEPVALFPDMNRTGNLPGGQWVITSDHHDADPGFLGNLDRFGGTLFWRINKSYDPDNGEFPCGRVLPEPMACSEREHPEPRPAIASIWSSRSPSA